MIKNPLFKAGMIDSLPICLSFSFIFTSIGAICHTNNISEINTILMPLTIFAAPLQIVIIYSLQHDLNFLYIAFISFVINVRFLLNSAVISPYFKKVKLQKTLIAMFFLNASVFTVSYTKYKTEDLKNNHLNYYFGVAIPCYIVAFIATIFGYFIVKDFQNHNIGLIFTIVLPLHFAALTAKRYPDLFAIIATLSGFIGMPFILSLKSHFVDVIYAICIGIILCVFDIKKQGKLKWKKKLL